MGAAEDAAAEAAAAQAATRFLREIWGLQGAAYAVLAMRYYAHCMFSRPLAWDDAFMVLATIGHTGETIAAHYLVHAYKGLANSGMTPEQRESLEEGSPEWNMRVNGSKIHVTGLLAYATTLWLLKGCWVVYYDRMTCVSHIYLRAPVLLLRKKEGMIWLRLSPGKVSEAERGWSFGQQSSSPSPLFLAFSSPS